MAADDMHVGLYGLLRYGTAGSQAATLTDNVAEVKFSGGGITATGRRRGKRYKGVKPAGKEVPTVSCKIWDIESDAFLAAVVTAWQNDTKIAIYAKDRTGGEGPDFDAYVTQLERDEDDEGIIFHNVTFSNAIDGRDFAWS